MTASDQDSIETGTTGPSTTNRVVRIIAAIIGLVFISGAFAGFFEARAADGDPALSVKAIIAMTLMGALGAFCLWTLASNALAIRHGVQQMPRRERASTRITIISLLLGGVSGLGYALTESMAPHLLFGPDGKLQLAFAATAALIWGVAGPWATRWWLNQTDEHERSAYTEGASWAAHALMFGLPVWWLLWKAGAAPQPDALEAVLLASFLWMGVWLRRKFY